MKTLFVRTLSDEQKTKLAEACNNTIDFLRKTLKLKPWECYCVIRTMYEKFPIEEIASE